MTFKAVLLTSLLITAATIGLLLLKPAASDARAPTAAAAFLAYNRQFGKTHGSQAERDYRFGVFRENKAFIERENAKGRSFTLGENAFTDLSFEEFASKYLSAIPLHNKPIKSAQAGPRVAASKDWRQDGKVTAVKNQGACGSCWAFSTIGSLESAWAIAHDELLSLSEMELVDCSGSYGNNGCNGGLMSNGFDYIKANQVALEGDYPYRPVAGACHVDKTRRRIGVVDYQGLLPSNVDGLTQALDTNPVSVAIEVRQDFQLYKGGVYSNDDDSCGSALNHGVLAVGYNTQDEGGYVIVKNSWGADWGEQGYVRMALGAGSSSGTCGIANEADVYPTVA